MTQEEIHKALAAPLLAITDLAEKSDKPLIETFSPLLTELLRALASVLVAAAETDEHMEMLLDTAHDHLDELAADLAVKKRNFKTH